MKDLNDQERAAIDEARAAGRKRLSDAARFTIDNFTSHRRGADFFRVGQRILQIVREGKRVVVEPPARIVAVRRYTSGRRKGVAIALEVRKRLRSKSLKSVVSRIGPSAGWLRSVHFRRIGDPVLVYKLGQLWPTNGG